MLTNVFFYSNYCWNLWWCSTALTMPHESASQTAWKWKSSGICIVRDTWTIMAPKLLTYKMSTNLPRNGPKRKPANYQLESRNDEVGVIVKQSGDECKEDQYWFRNYYMKYVICLLWFHASNHLSITSQ